MKTEGRPLSPHLSIYRWPITMTLSILHRMTGVALSLGLIVFVVWLEAIAFEAVSYDRFTAFVASLPGQLLFIGWSFAFFFHLGNGVRHLFWDVGMGFEKSQANASAWAVIIFSVAMTALYWLLVSGATS